ncbi:bifunctional 2-polyprenyl-6-hydroxyphenol methylase/3-demethylubiquinol 3-O-methyltransferase UbiG [Caulobacter sp. 17J80-11]|uniref:class I SAM-dependent methyltransferase n=1 Tax=Caulobacter sp. 17J80-11 TaxID=2763502 RepID=UPI0016534514|nr:class I SAM-dependent methyltransferase [Caulobacter sp. 17J80-11]MBC6981686.1 class I SAM-dependent methyltransferase [Caulobacter sp. 17J80-11]
MSAVSPARPLVANDEKRTRAWGMDVARSLWKTYAQFDIPWRGARTLDFGCHWGYLPVLLREEVGVAEAHGVDLTPYWTSMSDGFDPASVDGVRLFSGDVLSHPGLQDQTYDVVTTSGTLMTLDAVLVEKVVAWMYDRLAPGGHAVLQTRTYMSPAGADLHRRVSQPYPHLLFSERVLNQHFAARGEPPVRAMLPYCAATWLMLFRCAGFDLVRVEGYGKAGFPAELDAEHGARVAAYDRRELETGLITVHARKPVRPLDVAAEVV